jgi:nickel-dependent lactate racemase
LTYNKENNARRCPVVRVKKMKNIKIEYKDSWLDISVPETAKIVRYDTPIFPKIPINADPERAVKEALENPIGMSRIADLVKKGGKVTIAFDDPIKRPEPVKIIIPIVVEELVKAGINEEDITLLSANGAHCKWRPSELRALLGPKLYDRFCAFDGGKTRILNHDCIEGNVYLGETKLGDRVEYNKVVTEADQLIYVGTIFPVPFGGYPGQGVVVGLSGMKAMESHHSNDIFRGVESLHADHRPEKNLFRRHKLAIHEKIEKATGKEIFYVDAITGPQQKIVDVFAGHVPDLEKREYPEADRYFKIRVPQFDIVVIGLPHHALGYDTSDNPGVACSAARRPIRMWRNKPLLRKDGVLIVLGRCTGSISERRPADQEALRLFRNCFGGKELYEYSDAFWHNPEYVRKYRYEYAYSPFHSIIMASSAEALWRMAAEIIFTGEVNPGLIREMGLTPARNFEEALQKATQIVGKDADILVLPSYFHDPSPVFEVD